MRGSLWKHMEKSLHVVNELVHTNVFVHTAHLQEALDELVPLRIRAEAEKQRKPHHLAGRRRRRRSWAVLCAADSG